MRWVLLVLELVYRPGLKPGARESVKVRLLPRMVFLSGYGGIGRHINLKSWRRNPYQFDSDYPDFYFRSLLQLVDRADLESVVYRFDSYMADCTGSSMVERKPVELLTRVRFPSRTLPCGVNGNIADSESVVSGPNPGRGIWIWAKVAEYSHKVSRVKFDSSHIQKLAYQIFAS